MEKKYMIWWHSYVDEISRDATTLKEVSESVTRTLKKLDELKALEEQGKIRVKTDVTTEVLHKGRYYKIQNIQFVERKGKLYTRKKSKATKSKTIK